MPSGPRRRQRRCGPPYSPGGRSSRGPRIPTVAAPSDGQRARGAVAAEGPAAPWHSEGRAALQPRARPPQSDSQRPAAPHPQKGSAAAPERGGTMNAGEALAGCPAEGKHGCFYWGMGGGRG